MAGWRQAVELAMTDEEIGTLTALSRSRTERGEPGGAGANAARLSRDSRRSLPWDKDLASIIRRSSAASSGRWPMARWRHSMTDRDRARSRRSRRRPRPGWYRWRATRPRSTAIRTSCGRRGCWPAMRASTDRRQGTNVSPSLVQGTVCKILGQEEIKPHKVRYYLERRDAEFEQKMAEVLCVYREVQVLKKAAAKSKKSAQAGGDRLLRREAGNPGHRNDGAGFAARARRPRDLRAGS